MRKIDVDCMIMSGKEAIIGGVIQQIPEHFDPLTLNQRAYIKVSENRENNDFISHVVIGTGLNVDSNCKSIGTEMFQIGDEFNCMTPHVSVCSKHTDWESCLKNGIENRRTVIY